MMNKFSEKIKTPLLYFTGISIITFVESYIGIYSEINGIWMFVPLIIFLLSLTFSNKVKKNNYKIFVIIINIISLTVTKIILSLSRAILFFESHIMNIFFCILICIFLVSLVNVLLKVDSDKRTTKGEVSLFNLFYLNMSKAYEIAMLIDNKILSKVENELISEKMEKRGLGLQFGYGENSSSSQLELQTTNKTKVLESFEVQTTKSNILSVLLQKVKKIDSKTRMGDLVKISNVKLRQKNIDDMILALNILEEGKDKEGQNDVVEVNYNKFIQNILEGMTIDYTFDIEEKEYLIQLPYKMDNNFENGYQFNDLQLAELSIIGINRGEVDFSDKETSSSKILEFLSSEANKKSDSPIFESSSVESTDVEQPLRFTYNKLEGKLHLIDVIAITQELNEIKRGDE